MKVAEWLAYQLIRRCPPVRRGATSRIAHPAGSAAFERAYSQDQFDRVVRNGVLVAVEGLDVLELGCGHGGICVAIALLGARSVVGVDINKENLERAREFASERVARLGPGARVQLDFKEANAVALPFGDRDFDLVLADNAFEHFTDPKAVMREALRVLRPGGRLVVPVFSSIFSKFGLHIKNATRLPWLNLVFSERAIVGALSRLAEDRPALLDLYPGLLGRPTRIRELRKYGDLNEISFRSFKMMALDVGLEIEWFRPFPTRLGYLARALPVIRDSVIADVLSQGAAAIMKRPTEIVR